ncbi:RNA polymerase sigma-70 factor [Nocardia cyriacigeorgica]|nr:RNA polymerase sigma-70 factor [Nocardia cyriacigeorgica]
MGPHDGSESARRTARPASGRRRDARGRRRLGNSHIVGGRAHRCANVVCVLGVQARCHRIGQVGRPGAGARWYPGQHRLPGLRRQQRPHPEDRRGPPRRQPIPTGQARTQRGGRRPGRLPGRRQRVVHHRGGVHHRWRLAGRRHRPPGRFRGNSRHRPGCRACQYLFPGAQAVTENKRQDPATEVFLTHRNLLFTVAYEMLGSVDDAEDVVQETWLHWARVDLDTVRHQRAYLVRITTRQSLTRLRTLTRRRESYIGPWLPEPLQTTPDVAEDVELADNISTAMLLVLETLTPTERAVFVLREVFELPYGDIAETIGKSAATVRQIARRARDHVAARHTRMRVSRSERQAVVERFLLALRTGHLRDLMEVLAPDVVLIADGGGLVTATRTPLRGAERVAKSLARLNRVAATFATTTVWLNGTLGGRIDINSETAALSLVVENERITQIYAIANPRKLARLNEPVALAR